MNGEISWAFESELPVNLPRRTQCSNTQDLITIMKGNSFWPSCDQTAISFHIGLCNHLVQTRVQRHTPVSRRQHRKKLEIRGRRDLRNDVGPPNQPPVLVDSPTQCYFLSNFRASGTRQLNFGSIFLDVHDFGTCGR